MTNATEMTLDDLFDDALDSQIDTSILAPDSGEYNATITKLSPPRVVEIRNGERAGQSMVIVDVHYHLTDWKVEGFDKLPQVRSGIIVDTNANGKLDLTPGHNRQLGLIMEACGLGVGARPLDIIGNNIQIVLKKEEKDGNVNTKVVKWAKA